MMKTLLRLTLMLGVVWCLNSCTEAGHKGSQAAKELTEVWGNQEAMQQFATHYEHMRDSLWLPGSANAMNRAFIENLSTHDSMHMAALLIALEAPEFANEQASKLVSELHAGILEASAATARLALIDGLALLLGRGDHATLLKETIDQKVEELPLDDQALVYSRAATPALIGMSLKQERGEPGADTAFIARQVQALKRVYTAEQWQEFIDNYK